MMYDRDSNDPLMKDLFRRFNVVLQDKYDEKYKDLDYNEEVRFSEFHYIEEVEEE